MRASARLPSLRKQLVFGQLRRSLGQTARSWFRIVHSSVQADHVHLLVEADDKSSLSRGVTGVAIRLALTVNGVLGRRGRVWSDRFHARSLKTPREVRNGIVYVLMNAKKHMPDAPNIDICSSAASFRGWKEPPAIGPPGAGEKPVTEPPGTWLLGVGWKRHGLIRPKERPRDRL
jgi:REP element-mobilizing transposase RayT